MCKCQWKSESKFCLLQSLFKYTEGRGTKTSTTSFRFLLSFLFFQWHHEQSCIVIVAFILVSRIKYRITQILLSCVSLQSIDRLCNKSGTSSWKNLCEVLFLMENPLFMENGFFFPEDMYTTNNSELNIAVERDWNLKFKRLVKCPVWKVCSNTCLIGFLKPCMLQELCLLKLLNLIQQLKVLFLQLLFNSNLVSVI